MMWSIFRFHAWFTCHKIVINWLKIEHGSILETITAFCVHEGARCTAMASAKFCYECYKQEIIWTTFRDLVTCDFENFQNISCAHNSWNGFMFIWFPIHTLYLLLFWWVLNAMMNNNSWYTCKLVLIPENVKLYTLANSIQSYYRSPFVIQFLKIKINSTKA